MSWEEILCNSQHVNVDCMQIIAVEEVQGMVIGRMGMLDGVTFQCGSMEGRRDMHLRSDGGDVSSDSYVKEGREWNRVDAFSYKSATTATTKTLLARTDKGNPLQLHQMSYGE